MKPSRVLGGVIPADSQLSTAADSIASVQMLREKRFISFVPWAQGHLALARGDTAEALRWLREVSPNGFPECRGATFCQNTRLTLVDLLVARGDDRAAAELLAAPLQPYTDGLRFPTSVAWVMQRGLVNERLGNREVAVASYSYVIDMWATAEPALQERYVQPAREGLARLTRER